MDRPLAPRRRPLEALNVQYRPLDKHQPVTGWSCLDPLGPEPLSQRRDVAVKRRLSRCRWAHAPQRVDQLVSRDDLARTQQQEASNARCFGRAGVRSTPSACTSSLPSDWNCTCLSWHSGSALAPRQPRVSRPERPSPRPSERSVLPVPELSSIEERIVLLVAQGRSSREIAAIAGLDFEPSSGT